MKNPFVFGEVLDAQHLVDRKTELARVADALKTGGKLFLIGPRRYGKSSILRAAREVSSDATILLLNVEAYSDKTYAVCI